MSDEGRLSDHDFVMPRRRSSTSSKPLVIVLAVVVVAAAAFFGYKKFVAGSSSSSSPTTAAPGFPTTTVPPVPAGFGTPTTFTAPDKSWSAKFPGQPATSQGTNTVVIPWQSTTYSASTGSGAQTFTYSVTQFQVLSSMNSTPFLTVKSVVSGVVTDNPSSQQVGSTQYCNFDGSSSFPAGVFTANLSNGQFLTGQVVLSGANVYLVTAKGPDASPPGRAFFLYNFRPVPASASSAPASTSAPTSGSAGFTVPCSTGPSGP